MSWFSRLAKTFRRDRTDDELTEEMRFHLEMRTSEMTAAGIASGEAARRARVRFGNELAHREESRDVKIIPWLESIGRDVVYGLRLMRRNPILSVAAILSLALAIGANTAIYSLVDAIVFRPLPVHSPQQIIRLTYPGDDPESRGREFDGFSYPLFEKLRERARPAASLFAATFSSQRPVAIEGREDTRQRDFVQHISGDAFAVLGVHTVLGRTMTMDDDRTAGKHPVAVISYDYWTRRFARDRSVVGKWVRIDQMPSIDHPVPPVPFQIIGVAQRGFTGLEPGVMVDLWIPMVMWDAKALASDNWSWFRIMGRLQPGATTAQLQAAFQPVYSDFLRQQARGFPPDAPAAARERFLSRSIHVSLAPNGPSSLREKFSEPLWIVVTVVVLVLLIACANVANLLLALAAARAREMALRISIGAGRRRLIQQMLVESLLLALIASAAGLAFARWGAPALASMLSASETPVRLDLSIGVRMLVFVTLVCVGTTVMFGLAPALRASGTNPNTALKGGETSLGRFTTPRLLVAAQVAFSFVLIVAAALFLFTLRNLVRTNAGFDRTNVLLVEVNGNDVGSGSADAHSSPMSDDRAAGDKGQKQMAYWREALRLVRETPGVESAGLSGWAIFRGWAWSSDIRVPGHAVESNAPNFLAVSPGFFATMRTAMLGGRDFTDADGHEGSDQPVIVNRAFAARYFNNQNPVGMRFDRLGDKDKLISLRIVGLVEDAKYDNLRKAAPAIVYVPFGPGDGPPATEATLEVRTRGEPWTMLGAVRDRLRLAHPGFEIRNVTTQATLVDDTLVRERVLARLSAFFGCVAVLLSMIGLFGVLNYSVIRRTREIGIRMALGARAPHVVRSVLAQTLAMVVAGLVSGVIASLALVRFLESLLYGLKPGDPYVFVLSGGLLLLVALCASLLPATRAVHVDPMLALRDQ